MMIVKDEIELKLDYNNSNDFVLNMPINSKIMYVTFKKKISQFVFFMVIDSSVNTVTSDRCFTVKFTYDTVKDNEIYIESFKYEKDTIHLFEVIK